MPILVGRLQGLKGCVRGAIVDCRGCGRVVAAKQLSVAGAGGPTAMPILVGGLQGCKGCVHGAIVDCRDSRAGGSGGGGEGGRGGGGKRTN